MTKEQKVDDFIGQRFGDGGHLEVVSFHEYKRGKKDKFYKVKCHECAKDSELFGDGIFISVKSSLRAGYIPCGCSRSPKWTENQYRVLVERKCEERGYKFLGFIGNKISAHTKLKLFCVKHRHKWENTDIIGFLKVGNGCSECNREGMSERTKKPAEEFSKEFMLTGKFADGTLFSPPPFYRMDGRWDVYCPVCANDKYAAAGLCNGWFKALSTNLLRGAKPCRCSTGFAWTKEQQELRIADLLEDRKSPLAFVGWVGEYTGAHTDIIFTCPEHGEITLSATSFINSNHSCPKCSKTGFNVTRPAHLYILLASSPSSAFTGYGISGNLSRRIATHKRNIKASGMEIDKLSHFKLPVGQIALDIENSIKDNFPENGQEVEGFKKEATHSHLFDDVVNFVSDYLKQGEINGTETFQAPSSFHGAGHLEAALQ